MHYEYQKDHFGEKGENTTSRSIEVKLKGDLIFEETDLGPWVKTHAPTGGDSDYEKFLFVRDAELEKLVIELVRGRFNDEWAFIEWLRDKGIIFEQQFW